MFELFGFDLVSFIKAAGYIGLFGIVFAESGLFVGFFLPGDSLLFTAGFFASQGKLPLIWLLLVVVAAAIREHLRPAGGNRKQAGGAHRDKEMKVAHGATITFIPL